ncbi:MAG: hypothetical protein M1815_001566 [Lichina confinis]|nr:MAG: hypothetical protein M1815_001566 [Lichina confinis]
MKLVYQFAAAALMFCIASSAPQPQYHLSEMPAHRARSKTFGDVQTYQGTLRLQPNPSPGATGCSTRKGGNMIFPSQPRGSKPIAAVSVPRTLASFCGQKVRIGLVRLKTSQAPSLTYTDAVVWDICEECSFTKDSRFKINPLRATIRASPVVWGNLGLRPNLKAPTNEAEEVWWAPWGNQ